MSGHNIRSMVYPQYCYYQDISREGTLGLVSVVSCLVLAPLAVYPAEMFPVSPRIKQPLRFE